MGRALRSRHNLKIRQPLSEMTVVVRDNGKRRLLCEMDGLIREELNVKAVRFDADEESVVSLSAKANFKRLGKVMGPKMKEAATIIEFFSGADITAMEQGGKRPVLGHELTIEDIDVRRTKRTGVEVETQEGITVALNTEITPALCEECLAREFVNRVQTMRKTCNFNVTDRITIRCECPAPLKSALLHFREYVCSETLATELEWVIASGETVEKIEIDEYKADVQVNVNAV
jgi:isoleucyl-tRNA synthetase